jgi:hypothetical protein
MPLRLATLGACYIATLYAWFEDDSADLAKTMATLDRQLNRSQRVLGGNFGRSRPTEASAGREPPAAESDTTPGPSRRRASQPRTSRRGKQA